MGASWQLVFGAALHWASLLYQGVEFLPSLGSSVDASRAITPLSACVAIALSLGFRCLENRRVRTAIATACVASGAACLALTVFAPDSGSVWYGVYHVVFRLLAAVNIVIPVLLWGYAFASLDKRTAGHNVVYTALVSFIFAMAISLVSLKLDGANGFLNILARCVSGVILMRGGVYFSESDRLPVSDVDRSRTVRFYGGRAFIGVAIGALYATVRGDAASPWLMGIEIVVCLALLCFLNTKGRDLICEIVPVVPVMLAVLLWLPFAGAQDGVFRATGFLVIWLSWLSVSSFQLSGLKESLGVSGAFLSASEKAVLLVGWTVGLYAGRLVVSPESAGVLSFVAVAATLVWATASSLRTSLSRQEDEFADRANRERAEYEARVLSELRERFDLTAREAEITLMLSRGHSRPGICSQLGISDGTVRAHSSHIYTKLGVHRRDELILAVQEVEKGLDGR